MPHLERPIVPHMRLIESLPNLSLYDAWCWFDKNDDCFFYHNDNNNNQQLRRQLNNNKNESCKPPKRWLFRQNSNAFKKASLNNNKIKTWKKQIDQSTNWNMTTTIIFFDEKTFSWTWRRKTNKTPTYNLNKLTTTQFAAVCGPRKYFWSIEARKKILKLEIFKKFWNLLKFLDEKTESENYIARSSSYSVFEFRPALLSRPT